MSLIIYKVTKTVAHFGTFAFYEKSSGSQEMKDFHFGTSVPSTE